MSKYLVSKKVFKNKRPSGGLYDAEIEYLESTGTQYIDTNLLIQNYSGYQVELEYCFTAKPLDESWVFGYWNNNPSARLYLIGYYNQKLRCGAGPDNSSYWCELPYDNNYHIAKLLNDGAYFDGIKQCETNLTSLAYKTDSIWIFKSPHVDNGGNRRIKYCKLSSLDNILIRDFIPVRIGNVGYMYDKISGQLFENQGSGKFILGQDIRYPEIEEPEETASTKFIVGKRHSENISQSNRFSVIKKQFKTKFNLEFDSQGGTSLTQKEVILGETYGELPVPTKSQNIFIGWFTDPTAGSQITQDSIVELNITKLYARWEYVQIDSDYTSYSVTTTSSYRNTGIYTASISDSSQPIYIDWGDGTVEKTNSSISQKSHTYKTNGNFTVKISNNITSFAPSYNDSTWYGTTSQNRYTFNGMLTTGSKVTSIPTHAFYYCSAMTNIDFMETCWSTIMSLPDYCFSYCTGLTSIQGAKRFTSLGSYCFQYCSGLTGIQDLSEFKFTTLLNSYTFANCTGVTQWILPNGFNGTSFGNYMFSNNSILKYIGMKNYDVSIEDNNNSQQLPYDAELEYLEYTASSGSYIDTQIIPTSQGKWELDVQVVSTSGGSRFLAACPSGSGEPCLAIAVPDSGTSWYAYKYSGNWNDPSMSIDTSVRHLVKYCFQPNLQQVYVDGVLKATSTNTWSTSSVTSIKMFSIPSGGYRSRTIRIFRCKIYDQNDILVGDFIPVRINNVGYMYDNISNKMFGNVGSGNFVLGTDINDINNINHTTSKLPESLTSTGAYTFQNCSNLKNIIIPSKVQSIGNYAFYGCASLSNINIEATNLTAIDQYAFYNCSKLTDLDLPDTVKTIGNYAFYGCTSLDYAGKQNKEFPSQLTSIGSYAYQGCSNLKSLNIPENLQTIGDYAFAGCYQISSIIDKRLTAQTVSTNTFGSTTGTSNTAFTGYQSRGSNILSTYFNVIGYDENAWDDPLQNPDKCGFVQQYIDPENVVRCTVTFDAGIGNISETNRSIIKGKKIGELPTPRCPVDTPYFGGWFTNINGTGTKVSKDYRITSDITFYALYSSVPFTICNIDLNNQWRASSKANPDSSLYDGPYESNSNYNIGNAYSKMYIRISGYSTFNVYIRSYAESSYDYVVAMNLDVDVTSNPSSGTSNVKAHTSGKQNSGTTIGNYTKIEYTDIPDGEHFICIVYRKDGSVNEGDDRGYVLIDKQDVASIDSRSIFLVDDVGILYNEDKQLMIASEQI